MPVILHYGHIINYVKLPISTCFYICIKILQFILFQGIYGDLLCCVSFWLCTYLPLSCCVWEIELKIDGRLLNDKHTQNKIWTPNMHFTEFFLFRCVFTSCERICMLALWFQQETQLSMSAFQLASYLFYGSLMVYNQLIP